jgi:uncharacterized cupin superfamily protein
MNHRFEASASAIAWEPITQAPGTSRATVPSERGREPYRLAKWKAEPGTYARPTGMTWSETFVVYKGRGRLKSDKETVELAPGTVIDIVQGVPYTLEVFETLEKVAVITLEAAAKA